MPVTSVYRAGGGYGVVSDPGPTTPPSVTIPKLLPPLLGNVLRVDPTYSSGSGSPGGLPYATIESALSAATSGTTVWVMPGSYTISPSVAAGLTIPDGVSIRGVSAQTVIINYNCSIDGGAAFTAGNSATGSGVRIEDITLNVTATGDVSVTGIIIPYPDITKIRTCVINVNASTTSGSSKTAYGLLASSNSNAGRSMTTIDANGVPTPKMFSFNTVKGTTINVFSNGCSGATGARRGILVNASTCMTCRDANIYIGAPTGANPGTASYVGVETNDATSANSSATVQLRNCSIGSCVGSLLANSTGYFTASDVLQTTPASVTPGTTKTGIILGAGTDLITKTAGGKPLTVTTFPQTLSYNLKGTGTGWLSPGIQTTPDSLNNAPFTGQYFVTNTATSNSNNITLNTTAGLSVGMPIRFGTALNTTPASLPADTTLYITAVTATAIQVATTQGGTSLTSTLGRTSSVTIPTLTSTLPGTTTPMSLVSSNITTSGVTNEYLVTSVAASNTLVLNNTAGLVPGQPITFSNFTGTLSTDLNSSTTYYIATVTATGITLRLGNPSGSGVSVTGSGTATITLPTRTLTGSSNIGQYTVIGRSTDTLLMNSTSGLAVGLPISFASAIEGGTGIAAYSAADANTVYYIATVTATGITVTSGNTGGTARVLSGPTVLNVPMTIYPTITVGFPTASGSSNTITTATAHNFTVGTILTFTAAFGTAVAGTYHVKSVGSATTFNIASGPCVVNGSDPDVVIGPVSAGTALPISVARYPVVTGTISSSASSTLTLASGGTVNLVPGMPITFGANLGTGGQIVGGASATTYYVYQILTSNSGGVGTFNVSTDQKFTSTGTTAIILAGTSASINYSAQTIPASSNSALNFITFPAAHNLVSGDAVYLPTAAGGLSANTLYYVQNTPNSPSLTLSLMANPSATGGANMLTQSLTTSFTSAQINAVHTLPTGTVTVPGTTASFVIGSAPANFLVTGMPIVFGTSYGSGGATAQITAGTVYYVYQVLSTSTFTVTTTLGSSSGIVIPSGGGSSSSWVVALPTVPVPSSPIATAASSNLLTFGSAHNLLAGDALVFNAAITTGASSSLLAGTLYYVINTPSTTNVMLSATTAGVALPISTTGSVPTGAIAYYNATTGTCSGSSSALTIANGPSNVLSPGMPIVLSSQTTGGAAQGNVGVNTVYYVASNPPPSTTTFTLVDASGAAISPAIGTTSLLNYSAFSTGIQPQYFVTTTATNNITLNTTAGLSVGMPIQFGTTMGSITAGSTYYILSIAASNVITVSSTQGGSGVSGGSALTSSVTIPFTSTSLTVTTLTITTSNTITTSAAHNLVIGNVVVFGSAVGPFAAGVYYYVLTTPATTTFTLGKTNVSSDTFAIPATISNLLVSATGYYTFTASAPPSVTSASQTTGIINLTGGPANQVVPGMPIVFGTSVGTAPTTPTATPTNIVAGQTYYVASNPAPTAGASGTFYVSLTPGGPAIVFSASTTNTFAAFALAGGPPSVRIQTPSLLVGLATTLNNSMGLCALSGLTAPTNSLIITVYRTPASGGPTAATSFTVTYSPNDPTTLNKVYFDRSLSLAAGDRIQALAVSQGSSIPRDITAQLIIV